MARSQERYALKKREHRNLRHYGENRMKFFRVDIDAGPGQDGVV